MLPQRKGGPQLAQKLHPPSALTPDRSCAPGQRRLRNAPANPDPPGEEEPVNLIYYTIGEPDVDLALVNEELNRILLDKYGFTVEYHKIGWNDYTAQLNSLIHTNQEYDIAFAWTDSYVSNAMAGAWLDITPYLEDLGADMYRAIHSELWKGVTIDGKIWGIPTNKELATPMHFLFPRSWWKSTTSISRSIAASPPWSLCWR